MKISIVFAILAALVYFTYTAFFKDKRVLEIKFDAASLKKNVLGESSSRNLIVYLPPDYYKSQKKYPVVYFLHGFTANCNQFYDFDFQKLLDAAIRKGAKPFILVMPDSDNEFKGSFYANEWADYIAKDVVHLIDSGFRTLRDASSRGIAGHSMGGNGALKLAMLYPETFGSVYALSPSVLDWSTEFTTDNPSFKIVSEAKTKDQIFADFYASVICAMGRTYTPDPSSPHFKADFPVNFKEGIRSIDTAILEKWNLQFPSRIFASDSESLKAASGIKIDWGTQDPYPHIPVTCKALGEAMKARGLKVEFEAYEGDHTSGIVGENGRLSKEFIQFFEKTLRH